MDVNFCLISVLRAIARNHLLRCIAPRNKRKMANKKNHNFARDIYICIWHILNIKNNARCDKVWMQHEQNWKKNRFFFGCDRYSCVPRTCFMWKSKSSFICINKGIWAIFLSPYINTKSVIFWNRKIRLNFLTPHRNIRNVSFPIVKHSVWWF